MLVFQGVLQERHWPVHNPLARPMDPGQPQEIQCDSRLPCGAMAKAC